MKKAGEDEALHAWFDGKQGTSQHSKALVVVEDYGGYQ